MTHHTAHAHVDHPRSLRCPACAAEVHVPERDLVEGVAVRCAHCGVEAELTREWVEGADTHQWTLVDPEAEFPDEPAA